MPKKQPPATAKPKQSSSSTTTTANPPATAPLIDPKSQQRLLDIYAAAFSATLARANFSEILQEIKQALFNRDFAAAFGKEEYLEAYAARWSPTRTLCYAAVFKGLEKHICGMIGTDSTNDSASETSSRLRMLGIGGCAAEHVAFASHLEASSLNGTLTLLDSAPWSSISSTIQDHINSPPTLSPYASAAAKASNRALLPPDQLSLHFQQADVLSLPKDELARLAGGTDAERVLVTLLFTLNELYTEGGIGKTTKFLGALGEALPKRSLLLVVDSPGSYSEAALGKEKKRYPMQWLLDHTLLEKSPPGVHWERLESKDSVWFRLPESLSYPIPLENMRYQVHLYRLMGEAPSED